MPVNPPIGADYDHIDAMNLRTGTGLVRHMLKDAKARANIAPVFSDSSDYAEGDIVMYQGTLYRFSADHTAGEWTGTDATQITVEESALLRFLRFDDAEALTGTQKATARQNIQAAQVSDTDSSGSDSGLFIEY